MTKGKGVVLVVDDDPYVLNATALLLKSRGYDAFECRDPRGALIRLFEGGVDMVLTDIKMPAMTGIELLSKIHDVNHEMPVILMTAYADLDTALDAIRHGAFDLVIKPYNSDYLVFAVEKAMRFINVMKMERQYKIRLESAVRERTRELAEAMGALKESSTEMIRRLAIVAEYRDRDTGSHIYRIGQAAAVIAGQMKLPEDFIEALSITSMMHDLGKIGIPDRVLLKPGSLEPGEFEMMKDHTTIGHRMLSGSSHFSMQMAASIALSHHEAWDGSGYPRGLKGERGHTDGRKDNHDL